MSKDKNKSLSRELLRFLVTGIVCALLDYLVGIGFGQLCGSLNQVAKQVVMTSTGFVVGVTANYFLSTFWVFKNVKNTKVTKTPLFIVAYVLLSACGLGLNILTMWGCQSFCSSVMHLDITDISLLEIFTFQFWGHKEFWAYFVCFCIKTLVTMVWNYVTRKFILYRAPKKEEEVTNGN